MAEVGIKKINKLKDFGSFENFSWPAGLPEFKKNNLFYGKNGSGKTTLSHFFQCFEDGKFPTDFAKPPTMEVITGQGKTSDLNAVVGRIKVFNTYYIKNNLFWDGGHATNLLWLGKVDIEIQNMIGRLDKEIEQLEKDSPEYEANVTKTASSLDQLLVNHSKIIRNALSYPQSQYQKTHLGKDLQEIVAGKLAATDFSEEQYNAKIAIANASTAGTEVPKYSPRAFNLKAQSEAVKRLLEEKLTPTVTIEELMQNPALKKWVEDGLQHHHESGECKFCKQPMLSKDRLADLKRFFDDSQKQFVTKLQAKAAELTQLANSLDDKVEDTQLVEDFVVENNTAIATIKAQRQQIRDAIKKLSAAIEAKEKDLYADYKAECAAIDAVAWDDLASGHQSAAAEINKARDKHNDYLKNFGATKRTAQREIELHLALQQKDEFAARTEAANKAVETRSQATTLLKEKSEQRSTLKGQISSSHQAAEFINNLLRQMGHTHIKLDYDTKQQAYLLKRGGATAKRLSEGEKTAISFAHFIASLKQETFNLAESIIVIDDPISSLDATACYFIYGLVKSLEAECSQLFLMTHSHSFFVLLMRHFRGKAYGHYEVHRFTNPGSDLGFSKIVEMEEAKTKYFSEYNYLFSQIHVAGKEIQAGDALSFDRLYNLMNCSRKLMEAFLGFKYPHEVNFEMRWKKAVEDCKINMALQHATFRVINFGSHGGVDGFLVGSGLDATEMAESVSMVLDFVKQVDDKHYDGMVLCQDEGTAPPVTSVAA